MLDLLSLKRENPARSRDSFIPAHPDTTAPSCRLTRDHFLSVVNALGNAEVRDFETLLTNPEKTGCALRIDLTRGLNHQTRFALHELRKHQIPGLFLISFFGRDLSYCREGRLLFDKKRFESLITYFQKFPRHSFGLLLDTCSILGRSMNTIDNAIQALHHELDRHDAVLRSVGSSFSGDTTSCLNQILLARLQGKDKTPQALYELEKTGYSSWSFLYERFDNELTAGLLPADLLKSLSFTITPSSVHSPLPSLGIYFPGKLNVKRRPLARIDILYSTRDGFRRLSERGDFELSPEEAELFLKTFKNKRLAIFLDPSHFAQTSTSSAMHVSGIEDSVRNLPFPCTHYIGINSDADWSSRKHFEAFNDALSRRLTLLPIAGSAFLTTRNPVWAAWFHSGGKTPDTSLVRQAGSGYIDTMHGLAYSADSIQFIRDWSVNNFPLTCYTGRALDLREQYGLLLTAHTESQANISLPLLLIRHADGENIIEPDENSVDHELLHTIYPFKKLTADQLATVREIQLLAPESEDINALEIKLLATVPVSRKSVLAFLNRLHSTGLRFPVYTDHGGGEGFILGSCCTADFASQHADYRPYGVSRPATPFYLLRDLIRAGFFFFNGPGCFSSDNLHDISELVHIEMGQDKLPFYAFERFFSSRYLRDQQADTYGFGKHGATAHAFPWVLSDVLQRLPWESEGRGCIFYTHLGHRMGNQFETGQASDPCLSAALQYLHDLATLHPSHHGFSAVPWIAPTARLLTYSWIQPQINEHLEIQGHTFSFSSWYDAVLDRRILDGQDDAMRWLHGVTIFTDSPERAEVRIDGERLAYFTENSPDHTGRKSISLVDASEPRRLISGLRNHFWGEETTLAGLKLSLAQSGHGPVITLPDTCSDKSWELSIRPVSLAHATHLSFEVACSDAGVLWYIGFQDEKGDWYDAGTFDNDLWRLRPAAGAWTRYTIPLHHIFISRPPQLCFKKLRFRSSSISTHAHPVFRNPVLLRPQYPGRESSEVGRRSICGKLHGFQQGDESTYRFTAIPCNSAGNHHSAPLELSFSGNGLFFTSSLESGAQYRLEIRNMASDAIVYTEYFETGSNLWDFDIDRRRFRIL